VFAAIKDILVIVKIMIRHLRDGQDFGQDR
jgi:hypothetical protein